MVGLLAAFFTTLPLSVSGKRRKRIDGAAENTHDQTDDHGGHHEGKVTHYSEKLTNNSHGGLLQVYGAHFNGFRIEIGIVVWGCLACIGHKFDDGAIAPQGNGGFRAGFGGSALNAHSGCCA